MFTTVAVVVEVERGVLPFLKKNVSFIKFYGKKDLPLLELKTAKLKFFIKTMFL